MRNLSRSVPRAAAAARRLRLLLLAAVAVGSSACEAAPRAESATPAAGVVDSALPIPTLLARFRATVTDTPAVLSGGSDSPLALARARSRAIAAHDTAAVRALAVSKAEFGWLYYPHTKYVRPPYELGPELVWFTLVAASDKGAGRLLSRYGGRALRIEAVTCPDSTEQEGPNAVLRGCHVRFAVPDSAAREMQLFGALLKRDGRYKFLSYANDL